MQGPNPSTTNYRMKLSKEYKAGIPGELLNLKARNQRIVQIGYGGIGNCMVDLYERHVEFDHSQIIVIEMKEDLCREGQAQHPKVVFVNKKVTKENYARLFEKYLRPGDMLVDLAWYISTAEELEWCHQHNVKYTNAAVEDWDVDQADGVQDPREFSLYTRQMRVQQQAASYANDTVNPTAVLTHGANPGWVSHTTKWALRDWTNHIVKHRDEFPHATDDWVRKATFALRERRWALLAMLLNVQVIHISERDTLISKRPRVRNEFICTWSPQGFIEEGMAPAELGWGTHETLKKNVYEYNEGPKHQICLATRGMNTLVQTFVPSGSYLGMVVRHEEAYSIPEYLTVFDERGKAVYRPTVHYAYYPCSDAIASVYELQSNGYAAPPAERIPKRELIEGEDELGCFLLSKHFGAWWIGTLQSVKDAERLLPHQGPTVLVVAAGVLGSVVYCFENPNEGVIHPEKMEEEEVMSVVLPYLQPFVSVSVKGWRPYVTTQYDTKIEAYVEGDDWTLQKLLATPIDRIPLEGTVKKKRRVVAGKYKAKSATKSTTKRQDSK